jgi:hypothetical protein
MCSLAVVGWLLAIGTTPLALGWVLHVARTLPLSSPATKTRQDRIHPFPRCLPALNNFFHLPSPSATLHNILYNPRLPTNY